MTYSGINTFAAILLGTQWNNEDEATKDEWRLKADDFKKQHALIYPNYQYQPRKPSEKKRRVTRRKSGASAVVPDFKQNNAGNLVMTLDDDDLDDATFEAMHHNYNVTLPMSRRAVPTLGSVLFSGHTEESQWAIYQSQMDRIIQSSPTDADVDAEYNRVFQDVNELDEAWGMMDPKQQAFYWDRAQNKSSRNGSGPSSFVRDA